MSADLLREAASLMRERADIPYCTGEWEANGIYVRRSSSSPRIGYPAHAMAYVSLLDSENEQVVNEAVAEHIASWHPAVALAVADWLDEQAITYEYNERAWTAGAADPRNGWAERGLTVEGNLDHFHRHALTVARAYLGSDDA